MYTERKKILVFTDWYLPGYKAGGPIRSLANLVSRIDFDFYIVTRNTDHHSSEPYPGIKTGEWIQQSHNCFAYYSEEKNCGRSLVIKLLNEKKWHRIYLNSLFSVNFTLWPLRVAGLLKTKNRVILAPRGMLQPGALSLKATKKSVFLFLARIFGLFRGIQWHATSFAEEAAIKNYAGTNARVFLAPNLSSNAAGLSRIPNKKPGELDLISIARISPEKGIREAIKFLSEAKLQGKIEAIFYGTQQDPDYLADCKKLAENIPGVKISFPGEVNPSTIPALLSSAHFFYSATWGENHGHAIVEALQSGIPVIISNKTPWKNLDRAGAGWDLELSGNVFVDVLKKALDMNQEDYHQMCRNAASLGEKISNSEEAIKLNMTLFE